MADTIDASAGDEVKPYTIHVRTKHLDFTKQKLELTRFPHEGSEPKSTDWWEPKPQLEPLLDFWLEKYDWREEEALLNSSLPQFRTSITLPSQDTPLRLHFLHARSAHAHAVPLLLIPPFPLTCLSLGHLLKPLTDPEDAARDQPFHLVIPSLPGLGFSDPLPNNTSPVTTTADMLNTLMGRLSYPYYLATNSGPGHVSPAKIDWRLARRLATHYSSSCLGTHLISPVLAAPTLRNAPLEWAKWNIASLFRAAILGYSADDFSALPPRPRLWPWQTAGNVVDIEQGLNHLSLREPNTLAYALCDSPAGMLAFVLKAIQPNINHLTQEQIVTLTNLAWLPGPENAMRFWAHSTVHDEEDAAASPAKTTGEKIAKPRVAITVFVGGEQEGGGEENTAATTPAAPAPAVEVTTSSTPPPAPPAILPSIAESQPEPPHIEPFPSSTAGPITPRRSEYIPPAWGNTHFDIVHTQRNTSSTPSTTGLLLAFTQPSIIITGVRGLAAAVLARDARLKPAPAPASTAPLEQIIVISSAPSTTPQQSPPEITPPAPALLAPAAPPKRPQPNRGSSSWSWSGPRVSGPTSTSGGKLTKPQQDPKGKGKEIIEQAVPEPARLSPPARDPLLDGESPDTLVDNSPQPLEEEQEPPVLKGPGA
ncbi:epoxide hydrolase [Podospora didyma]|uniref:Epoxide hydrolase n=1 Tax=Podospora didyma TaxID=330526 RepID=A0AAE0NCN1_9PEZI|nr:epoxide hydrolase [Podospora didyma]